MTMLEAAMLGIAGYVVFKFVTSGRSVGVELPDQHNGVDHAWGIYKGETFYDSLSHYPVKVVAINPPYVTINVESQAGWEEQTVPLEWLVDAVMNGELVSHGEM